MTNDETDSWARKALWAMLESIALACVQGEWL
ncbi:hypothetical protein X551_03887 [Methylibium sp. T29]|nr:hypothetical protein X551_03887 [Methylibium sp. T29]